MRHNLLVLPAVAMLTMSCFATEPFADQVDSFLMSYVQPGAENSKKPIGKSPTVPRDSSPHGITLGKNIVPQHWTIEMTSDAGDYELTGSVTGPDGKGNATILFTSVSGQIVIEPQLWRRSERNRKGDRFTFEVRRSVLPQVSFEGTAGERFTVRLAQMLSNTAHTLELLPVETGEAKIEVFDVFCPPLGRK